jgi:hypothetical protein
MAEDWRVTVTLEGDAAVEPTLEWLRSHEVEDEVRERLGNRVAVSGGDDQVFIYADTEAAAREAERLVRDLLAQHGARGTFAVDRWHPIEEQWKDATVPLPTTPAEQAREHERREALEMEESQTAGVAEWEVRVELDLHRDAVKLAERLEREGESVVRRWKYLVVGANNEDEASGLALRLQREAPAGATIHVEPGGGMVWQRYPTNPFAVFGGLGM